MTVEIDSKDVIRLILQFCKEHDLKKSFSAIKEETNVSFNFVDDKEQLKNDVLNGKWDEVFKKIDSLSLSKSLLFLLHEQVVLEMMELQEYELVRYLMDESDTMEKMKREETDRYVELERLYNKKDSAVSNILSYISKNFYNVNTKQQRRSQIAEGICQELMNISPQRLLSIIGQSVKWQEHMGLLPPGEKFDLLRGKLSSKAKENSGDLFPTSLHTTIKLGKKSYACCASFSPDGKYFATGSIDNFVEIWNFETGKINTDLDYQAKDKIMAHKSTVLCITFSRDSELIASGSKDGMIKVFKVKSGKRIHKIDCAHPKGVSCIGFNRDCSLVVSGSFDGSVKIHGLNSGTVLKDFGGHQSFVNNVRFLLDDTRIISGSSDGTVKVWDMKSMSCVSTIRPDSSSMTQTSHPHSKIEIPVHTILPYSPTGSPFSSATDYILIGTNSPTAYIYNLKNSKLVKSFSTDNGKDITHCTLSPKGSLLYCTTEERKLICFDIQKSMIIHTMHLHDQEIIGMEHHPHINLLATFSKDHTVKIWKP